MEFGLIVLIFVVGLALIFAEVFVPGGIIGAIGGIILITSIVLAFHYQGAILGTALILVAMIVIPTVIVYGLRRITLDVAQQVEDGYSSSAQGLELLVGKEGYALTPLRPAGSAKIEGKKVDVVSEGSLLAVNTPLKVIKVEGNQVVVRATGDPPAEEI